MEEEKTSNIVDNIKNKEDKTAIKAAYKNLLIRIIVLLVVGYLLFSQVFLITQAKGMEMFPAIKDGDLIIGFRLQRRYVKNDVLVYKVEGKQKIGRLVARATDVVTIDEDGTLRVNGTIQSGEIMYPTYTKEGITYPYKVPEKNVFILGDYRTQAQDSRDLGPIPLDQVRAKVITILRRQGL